MRKRRRARPGSRPRKQTGPIPADGVARLRPARQNRHRSMPTRRVWPFSAGFSVAGGKASSGCVTGAVRAAAVTCCSGAASVTGAVCIAGPVWGTGAVCATGPGCCAACCSGVIPACAPYSRAPKRLGAALPGRQKKMIRGMMPTPVRPSSIHQPRKSMSCRRRTPTASMGRKSASWTMLAAPSAASVPIRCWTAA